MQGLMHLLEQALTRSQWQEPFYAGPLGSDEAEAVEDGSSLRKPRYLN